MNFKARGSGIKMRILYFLIFALFAFFGGALNGFLGTGGGILILFVLNLITRNEKRDSFTTCAISIIPISFFGAFAYFEGILHSLIIVRRHNYEKTFCSFSGNTNVVRLFQRENI